MIILASGSPRRKNILENHGIKPVIIKPEVEEKIPSGFSSLLSAEQTVMYFSLQKSLYVLNHHKNQFESNAKYIIASDTIVYNGNILGKPADNEEAFTMLSSLKAKAHYVMTGVAITNLSSENTTILCDTTKVFFKDYSNDDILEYIDKDSPLDKAGSYAIQSSWGKHVDRIEGDMENVIGLPWHRIQPIIHSSDLL